jgi:hypothetical protein
MPQNDGLPSSADLDAVASEQQVQEATSSAKDAHDSVIGDLTKPVPQKPDLTPGPDADAAIAYVEAKGYSHNAAIDIVKKNGVDTILMAKSHEENVLRPVQAAQMEQPQVRQTEQTEPLVSRHGEPFNPEIHAQLPTGDPKTDSTGRFILKEHDYRGPRPNPQFPD